MKAGLVVIVLVVIAGYLVYEPFPEDLEEPWKVRFITFIQRAGTKLSEFSAFIGYDEFPEVRLRIVLDRLMIPPSLNDDDLEIFDTTFDSVKVRVYKPRRANGLLPGVVFLHGGGWVLLSVNGYDGVTRSLAKESNSVVVSVDYRRAPEHQFPIPLEDCVTAVKYFLEHGKEFGANPARIGIAGDSAGGNLAAAVTQILVRDKNKFSQQLKFQVLVYPALQGINFKLPSMYNYPDYTTPLLKTRMMATYWIMYNNVTLLPYLDDILENRHVSGKLKMSKYFKYASDEHLPQKYKKTTQKEKSQPTENRVLSKYFEKLLINSDSSPLMSDDLSGLPPSLVVTAEYDPLRDQGLLYVERLEDAGVKVQNYHEPHSFHGFFTNLERVSALLKLTNFKAFERSLQQISLFIKQNT